MSKKKVSAEQLPAETTTESDEPKVYEATLGSGPSGAVLRGVELTDDGAVARRRAGLDVVVCGSNRGKNKRKALEIEARVGTPSKPQPPEPKAGPMALPHFHQANRDPGGHNFYETENRKARVPK